MNDNEDIIYQKTNGNSIASLILGILTLLSFCIGVIPIPFTGFICFPLSFLLGILALVFGLIALRETRIRNEPGRPMAWTGAIIGGFILLCMLLTLALILVLIFMHASFPLPPFLNQYHL